MIITVCDDCDNQDDGNRSAREANYTLCIPCLWERLDLRNKLNPGDFPSKEEFIQRWISL